MSKKFVTISIIVALSALLVISAAPRIVDYFSPSSEISETSSGDRYERVEVERYEIYFPETINDELVTYNYEDKENFYSLNGECLVFITPKSVNPLEIFYFVIISNDNYIQVIEPGAEFGRYVVNPVQSFGSVNVIEYSVVPIYDYVLVE
jgi:hypothetical protein